GQYRRCQQHGPLPIRRQVGPGVSGLRLRRTHAALRLARLACSCRSTLSFPSTTLHLNEVLSSAHSSTCSESAASAERPLLLRNSSRRMTATLKQRASTTDSWAVRIWFEADW